MQNVINLIDLVLIHSNKFLIAIVNLSEVHTFSYACALWVLECLTIDNTTFQVKNVNWVLLFRNTSGAVFHKNNIQIGKVFWLNGVEAVNAGQERHVVRVDYVFNILVNDSQKGYLLIF